MYNESEFSLKRKSSDESDVLVEKTMRKKIAISGLYGSLLLLLVAAMFSACFEAEKACLDVTATNFEPSADESCCCTYPFLNATILHRINDTLPLTLGQLYAQEQGGSDSFALIDFAYYVSDFRLFKQSEVFYIQDTVVLGVLDGADTLSLPFRDDILAVQRNNQPLHVIDTFPYEGIFSDISFRIGLKDSLSAVLFNKVPSGHPLGTDNRGLYDAGTNTYAGMWLRLDRVRSPSERDTIELRFAPSELPTDIRRLTSTQVEQTVGFDLTITIKVDYSIWMQDVDLDADASTIKDKILQNIEAGISVFQ